VWKGTNNINKRGKNREYIVKIVFIGCVELSNSLLQKLIKLEADIVGVITKKESNFNDDFVDLSGTCIQNNISYIYTKDINSEDTINWVKSLKPDIIFCFGWSQILKKEILDIARMGVVGFHPTLLPKNRGRHPIIWVLVLGLKKTGSTFFFMDEGADSGDILDQKEVLIRLDDDAKILYNRIIKIAEKQIEDFLPKLQTNTYTRTPQNHSEATYWRKRTKEDGRIDFIKMNAKEIYNLIRGLTHPYCGAHIVYKGKEIKIWTIKELNKYL